MINNNCACNSLHTIKQYVCHVPRCTIYIYHTIHIFTFFTIFIKHTQQPCLPFLKPTTSDPFTPQTLLELFEMIKTAALLASSIPRQNFNACRKSRGVLRSDGDALKTDGLKCDPALAPAGLCRVSKSRM